MTLSAACKSCVALTLAAPLLQVEVGRDAGTRQQDARVIERVTAARDSTKHYAVQLPPGFTSERRWPTLIVMDPRGRAMLALRLFAEAARSVGWVVFSSYETASDDPNAPNVESVNAILADAHDRWAADPGRIYLAGFSGTAREAWSFASELRGRVRGVIAAGAGITGFPDLVAMADTGRNAVALVNAAGVSDFNWSEVKATDALLSRQGTPHRTWTFAGGHAWPPAAVVRHQVEWLEALAMRTGFTPTRTDFLATRRQRLTNEADSLIAAGRLAEAVETLRDIARENPDSDAGRDASRRAGQLAASPALRAFLSTEQRVVEEETAGRRDAELELVRARLQARVPSVSWFVGALGIRALQRAAAGGDSIRSPSARRRLEHILVNLVFYEPRAYLQEGDTARARRMLEVAAVIDSVRARRAGADMGLRSSETGTPANGASMVRSVIAPRTT